MITVSLPVKIFKLDHRLSIAEGAGKNDSQKEAMVKITSMDKR